MARFTEHSSHLNTLSIHVFTATPSNKAFRLTFPAETRTVAGRIDQWQLHGDQQEVGKPNLSPTSFENEHMKKVYSFAPGFMCRGACVPILDMSGRFDRGRSPNPAAKYYSLTFPHQLS